MEQILIKKDNFDVLEELNSYMLKVSKDGKTFVAFDFSNNKEGFSDFKFAHKRLKNSGINIPALIILDKKNQRALVEYIEGPTGLDLLSEQDIDDKLFEQLFVMNYKARINSMRLDFQPHKFRLKDGKFYYLPFTFTNYLRNEDFTEKELKLWFYGKDGTENLLSHGYKIDRNRMASEFEGNKKMVLTVVKYFR